MFDFGNANDGQREAIAAAEGSVLIIAGPGTGKTYTLVQRAIYLIEECHVAPEGIFIATFTEKAAKELVTRITNAMAKRGITVNINDMYVGTFHSLCLRILKEHMEFTRLRRNYRVLDDFDQKYTVFQSIRHFRTVEGYDALQLKGGAWREAEEICGFVNNLSEELVEPIKYKVDIEIMDILRNKKELQLKRDSEAEVVREGDKLVIRSFYPMNLMQKLSLQKEYVEEWRQLVDSVMVDWNYDGVIMQPKVADVPGKNEMVKGIYDIPEDAGTIKVKITDILSESLELEV